MKVTAALVLMIGVAAIVAVACSNPRQTRPPSHSAVSPSHTAPAATSARKSPPNSWAATPSPEPISTLKGAEQAALPACDVPLQALIDAAAPGATVIAPPCIYRETITISKPLTLVGQPGAEIRGSDVWADWTQDGSYWIAGPVPKLPGHGQCADGTAACRGPEQVFIDGHPLQRVGSNPQSGQFAVDSARNIVLADNPSGHVVEVTTRQYWVRAAADNVTIEGFTMMHAANDSQTGALSNDGPAGSFANWIIENNTLSDAHGAVVSLDNSSGLQLLNNDISRGGQEGVHASAPNGLLVEGNTIHDNNVDGFATSWEAGGMKASGCANVTVLSNQIMNNDGPGLWFDNHCTAVSITNNRVYQNTAAGIYVEISSYASVSGNALWENGWQHKDWGNGGGIVLNGSNHVDIGNNIVAWNADGITVESQNRADLPGPMVALSIHNNVIALVDDPADTSKFALGWLQDYAGPLFDPASNNRGADNSYYYPKPEGKDTRFGWNGPYTQIAAFNATPGGQDGKYLTSAQIDQILSAAGVPLAQEQH